MRRMMAPCLGMRNIRCPVLATRGDTDVFTSFSDLERLAAMVPTARTVTIAQCGHLADVEKPWRVQQLRQDLWSL